MASSDREAFFAKAGRLANIGLVSAAVLSMSVFVYFFYWYTITGQRRFVSWITAAAYYGLPLTVAAALLASLRLTPGRRLNLLILCCSTTLCLYGLELALWFWYPAFGPAEPVMVRLFDSHDRTRDAARLQKASGIDIDARTRDEVLTSLRQEGRDAFPAIPPFLVLRLHEGGITPLTVNGSDVIPLSGLSNRLTVMCNEDGQWISYQSDSRGFSNPEYLWKTNRVEVAAIGDSYTQGYCVPPDRSFAALVRQKYPSTLNLGIAGDGPLLMLATLKEYAARVKPRIVLWFYFEGNDLLDLQLERQSPLLRNYLHGSFSQHELGDYEAVDQALLGRLPQLKKLEDDRRRRRNERNIPLIIRERVTLSTLRRTIGLVGGVSDDPAERDFARGGIEMFREVLQHARDVTAEWGGQLVFVYLPGWERYTSATSLGEQYGDAVTAVVRELGVPLVDVNTTFQRHGDPLSLFPFRRPGHYNEMGHRLVADTVLAALASPSVAAGARRRTNPPAVPHPSSVLP
jgi:hypothetical protein